MSIAKNFNLKIIIKYILITNQLQKILKKIEEIK